MAEALVEAVGSLPAKLGEQGNGGLLD